jgi:hypothetical protein
MMHNEILQSLARHFGEMTDKINARQEALKTEIIAGQEGLKSEIST